jgi:uncharacterized membrane protein (UPF0127 family)
MRKLLACLMMLILYSCQDKSPSLNREDMWKIGSLLTPRGDKILVILSITPQEQSQGLSGISDQQFQPDQGMLFFNLADDERSFWMPDTYFNLDLFFLDENLKVTDIVRELPHYKGRLNPQLIPRAPKIWSRHVLEMKSSSSISKNIQISDQLKWQGELNLSELNIMAAKNLEGVR